jgi:NADPH-dependent curcumin reductase CurA
VSGALPAHYRKVVIARLTGDFRSATEIVSEPWRDPRPGEVAIRNRWAGVNAVFDKNLCRNTIRYVDVVPPWDMGIESVGEVVAVGPGVEGLAVGDAVATTRLGHGFREYHVIDAGRCLRIREATPEVLALVPSGISALVGLRQVGEMRGGETVAVSAAAGGIGQFVVQLAKLAGNHVIGLTRSASKVAALRRLGCDRVIDYTVEDLDEVLGREYPRGIDLAYDTVGGEVFDAFVDHLALRGRLVISGHTSDFDRPEEPVPQPRIYRKLYWKSASVRGFQNPAFPEHFDAAAAEILALYYAGRLQVLVDPTPFRGLESVADAEEHLLAGHNTGKVVVGL